jgi:hypothetical protein
MQPPSKKTIIKALALARDIADQVWEDYCYEGLDDRKSRQRCLAYIDEKRQRNLTYDPEGQAYNFCFYLCQFDPANQYRFVEKVNDQEDSQLKCCIQAMCLVYFGLTPEDFDHLERIIL